MDSRLKAIAFRDAKAGWIVGEQGLLLQPRDEGKRCSRVTLDLLRNFDSVYIKGCKAIWIGGPAAMLTTGTGAEAAAGWKYPAPAGTGPIPFLQWQHGCVLSRPFGHPRFRVQPQRAAPRYPRTPR